MNAINWNVSLLASVTALLFGTAPDAFAQGDGVRGIIEEIIVTARKRDESLQDVPISIAALTESKMRSLGISNLEEASQNIASFTVQSLGPGQSQVAIRGVSAGQFARDQPGVKEQVGVYLDESVISMPLFTPDLDLYDTNRIEVLRGPQGTLFGSGSLAGTMRYITNQPNLDEFEATIQISGSTVDDGESGGALRGMINVPFGDGSAALRAVGFYEKFAGYIDAVQPDGSIREDVNGGDRLGFRVALTFQPTDALTITPRIYYQEIEVDGFNREDDFNILANPYTTTRPQVTLGENQTFTQLTELFTDDFLLVDLNIEWDFGAATLTSITSYSDRDILMLRDATALTSSITGGSIGLGESVYTLDGPLDDVNEIESLTQELRVTSSGEGRLQWVGGIFYSKIDRTYGQDLFVDGADPPFCVFVGAPIGCTEGVLAGVDHLFFSTIPYEFEQFAIFGEATYSATDNFDITVGARWYDFEETRILNFDGIFAVQTIGVAGSAAADGISPRLILGYTFDNGTLLYGQVAKGFRLGGVNDPLNIPLCTAEDILNYSGNPSFQDEELTTFEIGAKNTLWDGRGILNLAVFYNDISDLQLTLDAGSCSSRINLNVPKAHSAGVEIEFSAQVGEHWDFGISGSFIEAELDSTITVADAGGNLSVLAAIQKGNRLATVPETQFAANATYHWPWGASWNGFATGTVSHVGDRYTQGADQDLAFTPVNLLTFGANTIGGPLTQPTHPFDPLLPSYTIANFRVGASNDKYEIAFYIKNLTDEHGLLALDRERGNRARVGFLTTPPRSYGVQFTAILGN